MNDAHLRNRAADALRRTAALLDAPPPSSSPPPAELDPRQVLDFLTFFGASHGR